MLAVFTSASSSGPWLAFALGLALGGAAAALALFRRARLIRARALTSSRSVLHGLAAEQLAPFLPGFNYLPSDARFLGSPIDYVVFDGLADGDDVEIVLLEVKTGGAHLSERERRVRRAVDEGRVRYEVLRLR